MKKIEDERLKLQNLKNIRIAYIIQTVGILGILGYDFITKGPEGMTANPLWIVFMITSVISAYLSISVSVDHERAGKEPRKGLIISLAVITLISAAIGILVSITDGYTIINGILLGSILFICFLVPAVYIYYLRKKRQEENLEE